MTASTGSKTRPRLSNGSPRKASSTSPEEIACMAGWAVPGPLAVKSPRSRKYSAQVECERTHIQRSLNASMLRGGDTAHELGLGFVAGSILAFADLSGVADAGRGGFLRGHRSDHVVALREIGRQWRAHGHHGAGDRHRGGSDHPRLRSRRT